jgi:hypothetical protein
MMYREGWLIDPYRARSRVTPSCEVSWNALARERALPAVRFLVMHNCPVLERNGWRAGPLESSSRQQLHLNRGYRRPPHPQGKLAGVFQIFARRASCDYATRSCCGRSSDDRPKLDRLHMLDSGRPDKAHVWMHACGR